MIKCITIFCWGTNCSKSEGEPCDSFPLFPSLRLLMSAFCWFALMPHVAAPCISCIIPRTPSKDREDGRWQSGPAPRRALRLEGYYTFFFFSFCRSALLFRLRAVRELQVAETKGAELRYTFSFLSVTPAAWWKVSLSGTVIGSKPQHIALASLSFDAPRTKRDNVLQCDNPQSVRQPLFKMINAPLGSAWGWMEPKSGWSDGGIAKAAAFDASVWLFSHWTRNYKYHLKGSMAKWNSHSILRNDIFDILCLTQHFSFWTHGLIIMWDIRQCFQITIIQLEALNYFAASMCWKSNTDTRPSTPITWPPILKKNKNHLLCGVMYWKVYWNTIWHISFSGDIPSLPI